MDGSLDGMMLGGGTPPLGEVVACENCDGRIFRTVLVLRKVSALASGMPTGGLAPIQLFRCDDCDAINLNLIPKGAGTPEELFGMSQNEKTNE